MTQTAHKYAFHALRPLHLWHLASFDAPTVALTWSLAFAWAANVSLPLWLLAGLVLSCWSCYLLDRIADARKANKVDESKDLRARHHFHWRFRRLFFPFATLSLLLAIVIGFAQMPHAAILRNGMLAAAAVGYFSSVHWILPNHPWVTRKNHWKELSVALIFTVSTTLPTLFRAEAQVRLIAPMLGFFLLAWLNCIAIERWEAQEARERKTHISRFGIQLAAVLLVASARTYFIAPRIGFLLIAIGVSSFMLAILDHFRTKFSPLTLRACADLVLLVPLPLAFAGLLR